MLIVLTDGEETDSISILAQNVRDENIVVYAIGIANYNLDQLENIASSESHVYTLSTFSDLEKFISTITSSTCTSIIGGFRAPFLRWCMRWCMKSCEVV